MDHRTVATLMEAIAPIVREYFGAVSTPLFERLATLESVVEGCRSNLERPQDSKGINDALIDSDGCLVLVMTDGRMLRLARVVGRDGASAQPGNDGVGIADAAVIDGELNLSLTDGRTLNAGMVTGATGERGLPGGAGAVGRSIADAWLADGRLLLAFDDGTERDLGPLMGQRGLTGERGLPGPAGEIGPAGPMGESGAEGPIGESGPAGRGIAGISLTDDRLLVMLDDGTECDLGLVRGERGLPGAAGVSGPAGQDGRHGFNGRGIEDVLLVDRKLVVTFSDGSGRTLGPLEIPHGPAGRSITNARASKNHITLEYSDGSLQEVGPIAVESDLMVEVALLRDDVEQLRNLSLQRAVATKQEHSDLSDDEFAARVNDLLAE